MKKTLFAILMMATGLTTAVAQNWSGQSGHNYISTGMPILLVAPDAASAGMGDVGAATIPDGNSSHWNNAKYAFIDGTMGITTTFTPWLRNLKVGDMNLLYLSGYYRLNPRSTVAASLTYFALGDVDMTGVDGSHISTLHPNEFAIDATYALKLSDNLSLGATARYMRSDLTNGQTLNDGSGNTETHAGNSLAADLGLYYQLAVSKKEEIAFGLHLSNLGAKLSYSDDNNAREFLPSNMRLGGRYTNKIDEYNKISLMIDANKLLVPTPKWRADPTAQTYTAYNQIGVISGLFQSFADAPGGFSEELQEVQLSLGAEYWYANFLAVRAGYFYEHQNKGGRQYATVGVGIKYNYFTFDLSYLVPTTRISTNPLSNTIRIQLSVDLKASDNE